MPQIIPIKVLRNTSELSEKCHSSHEPLFVTKNGYGDLVVMSMEVYDDLLSISRTDDAINKAENLYADNGIILDARESPASLRRKHFE